MFSNVHPAFSCASAIGNLSSICSENHMLSCLRSELLWLQTLAMRSTRDKSKGRPRPLCCLLKLRIFSTISKVLFLFFHFHEFAF